MSFSRLLMATALCLSLNGVAAAQTFQNLLQDSRLSHWTHADGQPVRDGWKLEADGTLHLAGHGGNLITRELYGDFELWFEYRISEKGNNGIKYRVSRYGDSLLGIEYQIQDDASFPDMHEKHRTGGLYDLIAISNPVFRREYKPLETFNVGRIVVQNHRVRHWLNGRLIIDECIGTPRWFEAVSASKFSDKPGFGTNRCGHLMLTDHHSEVWFRNVFVRRLDGCPPVP